MEKEIASISVSVSDLVVYGFTVFVLGAYVGRKLRIREVLWDKNIAKIKKAIESRENRICNCHDCQEGFEDQCKYKNKHHEGQEY